MFPFLFQRSIRVKNLSLCTVLHLHYITLLVPRYCTSKLLTRAILLPAHVGRHTLLNFDCIAWLQHVHPNTCHISALRHGPTQLMKHCHIRHKHSGASSCKSGTVRNNIYIIKPDLGKKQGTNIVVAYAISINHNHSQHLKILSNA